MSADAAAPAVTKARGAPSGPPGRGFVRALRVAVSLALLGWLASTVELGDLRSDLAGVRWWLLWLPHVLSAATVSVGIAKWRLLMADGGVRTSWTLAARWYLVGLFASNFLPSNFGGDVVRIAGAARELGGEAWEAVTSAAVVERLTGFYGLLTMLWVGLAASWAWALRTGLVLPSVLATAGALAGSALLFAGRRPLRRTAAKRQAWIGGLARRAVGIADAVVRLHGPGSAFSRCMVLSLCFYVLTTTQNWMLAGAIAPPPPWTALLVGMCAVSLLAMLPVSFNGFGLQESGHVLVMTSLGFSSGQALLFALNYRLLSLVLAGAGGLVLAFGPARLPTRTTAETWLEHPAAPGDSASSC